MRPATLMYHDVVGPDGVRGGFEGPGAAVYAVGAAEFERQMDGIERALGTPPLRADEAPLLDGRRAGGWMLTFDDGGAGATAVGEALAQRGWRAHFFVVTALVGAPGFLDWEGIRALAAQGHAIGSHSHSHPGRIGDLSTSRLHDEFARSALAISEALGTPVTTASVPGGYYSPAVGRAAASAGISTLFTSQPRRAVEGVDGCAVVGRYAVRGSTRTGAVVAAARGREAPWLRQRLGWSAKGLAKRLAGSRYERLRGYLLSRRGSGRGARTRPPA